MILDLATKALKIRLAETATTECQWVVAFAPVPSMRVAASNTGTVEGLTSDTSEVSMLSSSDVPAGLYELGEVSVYNADNVAHTVEVYIDDATNERVIARPLVPAGEVWTRHADGSTSLSASAITPSIEHGSIYVQGGSTAQVLNATPNTEEKLTAFAANGLASSRVTPDHSADTLTIGVGGAGRYWCHFNSTVLGTSGPECIAKIAINGTSDDAATGQVTMNTSTYRNLSAFGILTLADGDVVSVNVQSDTSSASLTVVEANLSIMRITP